MAKIEIPGLEIKTGKPRLSDQGGKYVIDVEVQVVDLKQVLWHTLTKRYDLKWYEWPWPLFMMTVVLIRHKLGLFRLFDGGKGASSIGDI